ncbi:unnamed protein product [Camellia sinensis]
MKKDASHYEVVEPLPSYGRGIELPGGRYRSLINGYMLDDVVITGDNGTIDGQGSSMCMFRKFQSTLHQNHLTLLALYQNCSISTSYDAIALESGWDEYGIAYGRPTTSIHIKQVHLQASSGSALAFGNEMSGGISDVLVEHLYLSNSFHGVEFRTTKGRGEHIKEILIVSDIEMKNVHTAFGATGESGSHPDEDFDPNALPILNQITLKNVIGTNITVAGNFTALR